MELNKTYTREREKKDKRMALFVATAAQCKYAYNGCTKRNASHSHSHNAASNLRVDLVGEQQRHVPFERAALEINK